ncbi:thiamine pyrophosphokinase [Diatrype stigma]|uniref:Thiamine pyrophosphokinase n=1 Tax=Diatrype stigma TaxID=117547 RepID=A0AAN9UA64_9PEZI
MSSAEPPITEWDPTPILDERLLRGKPYRFSLVILNQPIHNVPLFLDLWRRATVRIAADGGANRVYAIRDHLPPPPPGVAQGFPRLDFIVGDLDSLQDETKAWFLSQWSDSNKTTESGADADANADADACPGQIIYIDDQDSADFAKAVKHARELARRRRRSRHASRREQRLEAEKEEGEEENGDDIICYSGLGGRVDQAMSQLHHLYLFQQRRQRRQSSASSPEGGGGGGGENEGEEKDDDNNNGYASGRMYLTNGESLTFVLLAGQHHIRIRSISRQHNPNPNNSKPLAFGKHVGIIPLAGPSELTTRGLQWDVSRWRTAFGERLSTSNHTTAGADVVEVETSRDVLFTIDVPVSD